MGYIWDYQPFEVTIGGTVQQFVTLVEDFEARFQQAWLRDGVRLNLIPTFVANLWDDGTARVLLDSPTFRTVIHAQVRADGRTQLQVEPGSGWGAEESWAALWVELGRLGFVEQDAPTTQPTEAQQVDAKPKARGPNENTRLRAEVFKRLKDAHPEWGYNAVAQKACEELRADNITAETVRYAYKAMNWTWERANTIR